MPKDSQGVRMRKPSNLVKGLVAFSMLVSLGGCNRYVGEYVATNALNTYVSAQIQQDTYRQGRQRRNHPRPTGEDSILRPTREIAVRDMETNTGGRSYDELPLIFLATGGINDGEEYKGVGTNIITPDMKEFYIVGRNPIFQMGKRVTNRNFVLDTGDVGLEFVKDVIEGKEDQICTFYSKEGFELARKKGLKTTSWKNVWYVDGKEIGSVRFILVDSPEYLSRD